MDRLGDELGAGPPAESSESAGLDVAQRATAHLARIAVESHTSLFGFYWRYVERMDEMAEK